MPIVTVQEAKWNLDPQERKKLHVFVGSYGIFPEKHADCQNVDFPTILQFNLPNQIINLHKGDAVE